MIEHVEGHYDDDGQWVDGGGDGSVIWGSGAGSDRLFAQSSMLSGWVNHSNVRPINFTARPAEWDRLGIRKTIDWQDMIERNWCGQCTAIKLASSSNGTGTYGAELWRGGQLVHTFMIGIYPHPGSQSWGDVEGRSHEHIQFLRDLAFRTPSQPRVIRINADDFE